MLGYSNCWGKKKISNEKEIEWVYTNKFSVPETDWLSIKDIEGQNMGMMAKKYSSKGVESVVHRFVDIY